MSIYKCDRVMHRDDELGRSRTRSTYESDAMLPSMFDAEMAEHHATGRLVETDMVPLAKWAEMLGKKRMMPKEVGAKIFYLVT